MMQTVVIFLLDKLMKAKNRVEDFNMMLQEMRFMMENLKMKKNPAKDKYLEEMVKFYKEILEIMLWKDSLKIYLS
jgi:GTP1/Obg family GTP-binding protein